MCNDMVNETNRRAHTPSQIHTGMSVITSYMQFIFIQRASNIISYIYMYNQYSFTARALINTLTINIIAKFFTSGFDDAIPTNYIELMVYYVEQLTMY